MNLISQLNQEALNVNGIEFDPEPGIANIKKHHRLLLQFTKKSSLAIIQNLQKCFEAFVMLLPSK